MTPNRPIASLLLAGSLLLVGAASHAASLSADPNPVCADPTGDTVVDWDTGTTSKFARLKRKAPGSASWQEIATGTGKGQVPQPNLPAGTWQYQLHKFDESKTWTGPIQVSVTQSACQRGRGNSGGKLTPEAAAGAAAGAGRHHKPEPKPNLMAATEDTENPAARPIPPPLQVEANVKPVGNGLQFDVKANEFVKFEVYAFQHYAPSGSQLCSPTNPSASWVGSTLGKQRRVDLKDLEPNTTYQYAVCATIPNKLFGGAMTSGYANTLRRKAQVIIDQVDVSDDGDPMAGGAGELRFELSLKPDKLPYPDDWPVPVKWEASVNSGETVFPKGLLITLMDPPDSFVGKFVVSDDDPDLGSLPGAFSDVAYLEWPIPIGNQTSTAFVKSIDKGPKVQFKGRVIIGYVP